MRRAAAHLTAAPLRREIPAFAGMSGSGTEMFYVYILSNRPDGPMYVGMTDDLLARAWQHREHQMRGFTDRYNIEALVWYELHDSRDAAFTRERQIKKWRREWKDRLVREFNPEWRDLFGTLL